MPHIDLDELQMLRVVDCETAKFRLPRTVDRRDIQQAAALRYLQSMRRFDPARGFKQQTLGAWAARSGAMDYLRQADPLKRGDRKRVKAGKADPVLIVALDGRDVRTIPDTSVTPPDELAARAERARRVAAAMRTLDDRDWQVVALTFWCELTLREVGERLGVNESRVCQLRTLALGRLRDAMESDAR